MSIEAQKKLEIPKNPKINCEVWKKRKGYLAYLECTDKLHAMKLSEMWMSRYPSPETFCGGGNKDKDPRCAVPAPGFNHPHVVMIDDHFYTLHIDM